jgi:molybdopterin-synthase adenylyltransferase
MHAALPQFPPAPMGSPLTDEERATYEWQLWVPGFGEEGQRRLKGATALVSRVGGLGGPLAQQLAAAGIGRLLLAHAGNLKPSDLNRQILMTAEGLGKSRVATASRRLRELNPRLEVVAIPENISPANAETLVAQADIVFGCAPLFPERFALNDACLKLGKPLVDAAMYDLEGQVTTMVPGVTSCLRCRYPELPSQWRREFPVIGAVSATAASLAAMEGIKLLAGMGGNLLDVLLFFDLREMIFRRIPLTRRPDCPACAAVLPINQKT